jgi:hypothetical protein
MVYLSSGVLSRNQPIAKVLSGVMIYCIGALPEMDHQLGCGICTIISVLKPAPIVG